MEKRNNEACSFFFFCYNLVMKHGKQGKIRVAVLCGGRSAEHEVSVQSARNIIQSLDCDKYDVVLIGIDKHGTWLPLDVSQLTSVKVISLDEQKKTESGPMSFTHLGEFLAKGDEIEGNFDVVFPVLHGPMGEDGTIQGLLKLASIPFVGAGVLGSAVGMDKVVMKRLLRDAGLPTALFLAYKEHEKNNIVFEEVQKNLGLPFFVKPANLGSSVGVSKVHNKDEFFTAVTLAFSYDNKILIEEYIKGKEIECSVLGNEKPIASVCGEIIPQHEFYSYEAKYLDKHGASFFIPARISRNLEKKIRKLAIETFETLYCEGMARVDFFVTEDEKVFVNEINTIPGFTSISMYPKLWEASGIPHAKLIDTLIDLALERSHKEQRLQTSFLK